jgi:nitroreductase
MEIQASRWFDAIKGRRSRRSFQNKQIKKEHLAQISSMCDEFHPYPSARSVLVRNSPDKTFKGVIGSFGKIKNSPAFIAFIGDLENPNVQEQVGYTSEGIILEAEAIGLSTCWVGGFFNKRVVESLFDVSNNEKVIAITPVGYAEKNPTIQEKLMTGFGRTHRRKELSSLISGIDTSNRPDWVNLALEAVRLAPSAANRQPWRFHVEQDSITVSIDNKKREFGISKRLDCGIAMLHLEIAILNSCISGRWQFLKSPAVARFMVP